MWGFFFFSFGQLIATILVCMHTVLSCALWFLLQGGTPTAAVVTRKFLVASADPASKKHTAQSVGRARADQRDVQLRAMQT
jgi:hypothetical protein